ncbi:uncharacterized protein SCHCODRAFT_02753903 [Schizophyllum commune H4-8]|uniref:uncharacterized protein n=1 Tax=Schizophyllum commune (strain H4-8 / FGSC 9210) TaxID=578458 RepID=UPI002160444C|nr:uncharacterized protein SCHCODRAFT_02753903 [Schizophyllum commune H4-8]KAI5884829.1 hypothetical protein SCHCODRAFT_02753903 [Schizophyllum commune H4-8]
MHPALNIAELCFMIARTDVLHRADLYCLALVCRHWRDVAEAILWEVLPDLDHLLMLMPPDVWSTTPKRDWHTPRALVPKRDLLPGDWALVLPKSKLVRRLTIASAYTRSVQEAIEACPPPHGFLSNLRALLLGESFPCGGTPLDLGFLKSIAPLRAITRLSVKDSVLLDINILAATELCQNLDTVTAFLSLGFRRTRELDDMVVSSLETLAPRISSLHLHFLLSFKSFDVDDAYLSRISVLPSLARLSLHHMRSTLPEPIAYPPTSFAHLRDLSTNGTPVATLVDIIRLAGVRLERIYSTFRSLDVAQLELLVKTIRDRCSPEVSLTLFITSGPLDGDDYLEYFRPLAHFEHVDVFLRDTWHWHITNALRLSGAESTSSI